MQFQAEVSRLLRGKDADPGQFLADNVEWHLPDSMNDVIGGAHRIGITEVVDLLVSAVPRCYKAETMKFDFHSMMADEHHVHLHFTLQAETITSKPYKSGYQTLYELNEGKITHVWEYFDSGLLLKLLQTP